MQGKCKLLINSIASELCPSVSAQIVRSCIYVTCDPKLNPNLPPVTQTVTPTTQLKRFIQATIETTARTLNHPPVASNKPNSSIHTQDYRNPNRTNRPDQPKSNNRRFTQLQICSYRATYL